MHDISGCLKHTKKRSNAAASGIVTIGALIVRSMQGIFTNQTYETQDKSRTDIQSTQMASPQTTVEKPRETEDPNSLASTHSPFGPPSTTFGLSHAKLQNPLQHPTMSRSKFTVEDGMMIQFCDLAKWKTKLNTKCYRALQAECHEQNRLLSDTDSGHKVFRGQDLTTFIENYNPKTK